ncbi:putative ribonuclease H-like superfamily, exonuclease, RNase T/DNA polymerase III [Helianthus annuus]|nr:putative ribonuclease H-like superfamily, exonuclease, RNase T/DNA polymerase III [Helianthus annuus]
MQDMSNEIVFFDLETNLVELESYCTLIRPGDLSAVGLNPARCHGISRGTVLNAPSFEEVADKIFKILNGRIWAGHNIRRFDCVRIKEAFKEIGRPAPEPVALIDSLGVLSEKFGKRAGNMKMASLAAYFGLGEQNTDDVRMNLEVLKHCATVLFLIKEPSVPTTMTKVWHEDQKSSISSPMKKRCHQDQATPMMTTRSRSKVSKPSAEETNRKSPSVLNRHRVVPYPTGSLGQVQ